MTETAHLWVSETFSFDLTETNSCFPSKNPTTFLFSNIHKNCSSELCGKKNFSRIPFICWRFFNSIPDLTRHLSCISWTTSRNFCRTIPKGMYLYLHVIVCCLLSMLLLLLSFDSFSTWKHTFVASRANDFPDFSKRKGSCEWLRNEWWHSLWFKQMCLPNKQTTLTVSPKVCQKAKIISSWKKRYRNQF